MTIERDFAFEQVNCKYDHVAELVSEMRDESERWLVEFEDGSERETSFVGLAWYAREFDDEAEVTPLE